MPGSGPRGTRGSWRRFLRPGNRRAHSRRSETPTGDTAAARAAAGWPYNGAFPAHHGAQDQLGPGTFLEAVDLERRLVEVGRLRPYGSHGLPAALEAGGTPIAVARHELAAATLELPLHDETRQEAHGPRQDAL